MLKTIAWDAIIAACRRAPPICVLYAKAGGAPPMAAEGGGAQNNTVRYYLKELRLFALPWHTVGKARHRQD